jgi:hypothetical protein
MLFSKRTAESSVRPAVDFNPGLAKRVMQPADAIVNARLRFDYRVARWLRSNFFAC